MVYLLFNNHILGGVWSLISHAKRFHVES